MSIYCLNCHKEIEETFKGKKFCSKKCANIYNSSNNLIKEKIKKTVINNLISKGIHVGEYEIECLECHKKFKSETKNRKFCCSKCSALYGNRNRTWKMNDETKIKISQSILNLKKDKKCIHKEIKKDKKCVHKEKQKKLDNRKYDNIIIKKKICRVCGQEKCQYPDICSKNIILKKKVLEKLGFDFSKYGTIDVYNEYHKINKLILDLYYIKKLNLNKICKLYNISSESSLISTFKMYNLKIRNHSEAIKNALENGWNPKFHGLYPIKNNDVKYNYKHGWHTTWDNNQVYYRSSYELKYAQFLDNRKIHYDMEFLNIKYFDSTKNRYRISIPDFFIPSQSLIVEIKSDYTYNKQNMIDRFRAYKQNGYKYKLILEGKDYGKKLPETRNCFNDKICQ